MNKKYSLALGGGAARGICHIGVIKYIEEKKIEIEEISGTSMGAIIGGAYALGINSDDMIKIISEIKFYKLVDFNLHEGIVYGDKVYDLLYKLFGDKTFKEVKIPLKIIATNLKTGEKNIFTKGKIIDAVRASISLPGVFIPHKIQNDKFLDGGLHSNLPVLELEGKHIIAVSAIREEEVGEISPYKKVLGFKFKTSFIKYNYRVLKKTISIMMMNNENLSITIAKNNGKNINLITPKVGKYEYFDFHKFKEIIDLGYEETKNTPLD